MSMGSLRRDLSRLVGSANVSDADPDRAACGRDMWPRTLIGPSGLPELHLPDIVVWPRRTREVVAVVRYAARHGIPLVPYGAGSGVCGGAIPIHAGIVLDLKRMNRVLAIEADDHAATFECGILGQHLEDALAQRGLTLGHFPSSIYCSTLGGWLAARSAGQCSSRYGKIEDMVLSLEAVDGRAQVIQADREQQPDLTPIFVGSEGTLAVITQARLRVWPQPETRLMRGWHFRAIEPALDAARAIMQLGLRPAVVRLYDALDTALSGLTKNATSHVGKPTVPPRWLLRVGLMSPPLANSIARAMARHGVLLVLGFEGPRARAHAEAELARAQLVAAGGTDLGETPGQQWLAHRYRVSYKQSPIFSAGAFVDTMEVATTWDRLLTLYNAVLAAIGRHALVMAHFSHAYPSGCSIYFTFVGRRDRRARERYDQLWKDALNAALDAGGTLSHHHGVGLMKVPFLAREHGQAMTVFREFKRAFDPKGVLNPGKLGL